MNELRWTAPEFEYHEKGAAWETTIIVVAALLILGALLLSQNFLFAVLVVVAAVLLIFWGRRRPRVIEFVLNQEGLAINGRFLYHYKELSSFSIAPDGIFPDGLMEIVFLKKTAFSMPVKIFAHSGDRAHFREFLSQYLPEAEYEESFVDHLARFLRF